MHMLGAHPQKMGIKNAFTYFYQKNLAPKDKRSTRTAAPHIGEREMLVYFLLQPLISCSSQS